MTEFYKTWNRLNSKKRFFLTANLNTLIKWGMRKTNILRKTLNKYLKCPIILECRAFLAEVLQVVILQKNII